MATRRAVDGNTATYFDGPTANGNCVGRDLGSAKTPASSASARVFGNASWAEIVGASFVDANFNSIFHFGEGGMEDVRVFLDLNNDGDRYPGDPHTRAQGGGFFE